LTKTFSTSNWPKNFHQVLRIDCKPYYVYNSISFKFDNVFDFLFHIKTSQNFVTILRSSRIIPFIIILTHYIRNWGHFNTIWCLFRISLRLDSIKETLKETFWKRFWNLELNLRICTLHPFYCKCPSIIVRFSSKNGKWHYVLLVCDFVSFF
jgi:hypothetical protein